MNYFVETIHGVVVDVFNNLKGAIEFSKEKGGFSPTPKRVYYIEAGFKKYVS